MEPLFVSAECKAFTTHYKDLCNTVEDPDELATELTTAGIFGQLVCDGIQSPALSRVQKSSKLTVAIEAQITANTMIFHVFLRIIAKDVTLQSVAARMQDAYDRQLVEPPDVIGTTTGPGTGRDEKEAVLSPRGARLSVQLDQSYDVYLSFVASDMPFAQTVYHCLTKRAGFKVPVVVPAEDMHSEPLVEGIVAEMITKKCRKTILILSPEYFDSEWGRYEATLSVHSQPVGLRAIPIVYKPCQLPGFLQPMHCLDYSTKYQSLSEEEIVEHFWQNLIHLIAATADQALAIEIAHLPNSEAQSGVSAVEPTSTKIQNEHCNIFLSSTAEDIEIAENVCNTLQTKSLQTFLPISDLMPGISIVEQVADTILQVGCQVVVLLSPAYLQDTSCLYECRVALYAQRNREGKCIIPIMYKECDIPQWMKRMFTCEVLYFKAAGFWKNLFLALHHPAIDDVSCISETIQTSEFAAFSVFRDELKSKLLPSVSTVKHAFTANIISAEMCEALLTSAKDNPDVSASLVAEIESRIKKQPAVFHHLVEFLKDEPKLSYLALKLHSTCVNFSAGNLDSILYNATYISEPIDSDGKFIDWGNYGIAISIPPGAVPQGNQLQIMMGCSLSVEHKLPVDCELVSPVFLILPGFHFREYVEMKLEHWSHVANSESIQSLTFVSASIKPHRSIASQPNYHFQRLSGGRFEVGSQVGKISVKHFCLLAIARCLQALATVMLGEARDENEYVALLYNPLHCVDYKWTTLFGISVRSKAYEEVLRQQVETLDETVKYRATSAYFSFKERSVSLDIPYGSAERQGFWIMPDKKPCKVLKKDVDYALRCWKPMCDDTYPPRIYLYISPLPAVEGLVQVEQKPVSELNCQLTLMGTMDTEEVPKLLLKSPRVIQGSAVSAAKPHQQQLCPAEAELNMDEDLLEIKGYLISLSREQLISLGQVLGLTYRRLRSMNFKPLEMFLNDMLVAWLQQQDNVGVRGRPTWRTLEAALRHFTVGQNGIAERLAREKR